MLNKIHRFFVFALAFGAVFQASAGPYGGGSDVSINGRPLSAAEVLALQKQIGIEVAPGNYLVDLQSGCWANLSNGTKGCLGNAGSYVSRSGSGERSSNGDWSHRENNTGMSVGGTGNGCIYAGDWSNC